MGCRALVSASIPVNAPRLPEVVFDSIGTQTVVSLPAQDRHLGKLFFSIHLSVTRAIMAVFAGSYEQHSF